MPRASRLELESEGCCSGAGWGGEWEGRPQGDRFPGVPFSPPGNLPPSLRSCLKPFLRPPSGPSAPLASLERRPQFL